MGGLLSRLFESDEARRQREAAAAIEALRAALRGVDERTRQIEVSRKHVVAKLAAAGTMQRRFLLSSVREHDRRLRDHYALATTTAASIGRLEDSATLSTTVGALRSGSRATLDVERIERIVDDAATRQEELADAFAALSDHVGIDADIDALDDAALEAEVARLLDMQSSAPGDSNESARAHAGFDEPTTLILA